MMLRALACLSLVIGAVPILAWEAQAQSCGELWYRRNSIYKQAGYCFKTARHPGVRQCRMQLRQRV
jgi:hypothetical protein